MCRIPRQYLRLYNTGQIIITWSQRNSNETPCTQINNQGATEPCIKPPSVPWIPVARLAHLDAQLMSILVCSSSDTRVGIRGSFSHLLQLKRSRPAPNYRPNLLVIYRTSTAQVKEPFSHVIIARNDTSPNRLKRRMSILVSNPRWEVQKPKTIARPTAMAVLIGCSPQDPIEVQSASVVPQSITYHESLKVSESLRPGNQQHLLISTSRGVG